MTHAYPDPNDQDFREHRYMIPPKRGITAKYECPIVKGKVYIRRGLSIGGAAIGWKAILMLDLGANCHGVWTQCNNIKILRSQFACQVKDNKNQG